ncbi:PREDICTED: L-xylulose reductase-like [Ceratosolen solmsi marchali]|uniref:L-xylulose reductase-like n=1 Tax=Ceratosolen solmsi marchali TaxID=326594 RepID=A0AAJ7E2J3_9HYME|nr:PREDICTED: L-xylulose reductase-like [Ceratosolen solmsi marchali]
MNISFDGKRVLVTGASRGIGKNLALRLSKYNATVIALSKTKKYLDILTKQEPNIQTICVDLRNWQETRQAIKNILPIDLLVNNAGVACLNPFLSVTPEDCDLTFDVNIKSIINVSQVVVENMIERKVAGSIVNVSSQASCCALNDHAVYSASKGAVDILTKTMALELGSHKIRVNTVNPTVTMTDMGKLGWSDETKAQQMLNKIPLGRFAEVDEVTDAIIFLLSNHSSMITGANIPVDGGFLAT